MVTAETVAVQCHGVSQRGIQCKRFRWLPTGTRWGCVDHPLRPDEQPELEEPAPIRDADGEFCQRVTVEAEGEQITARVRLSGRLNAQEQRALNELILAAARRFEQENPAGSGVHARQTWRRGGL